MIDWSQIEHAEIRKLAHSTSALRNALTKFCAERARKAHAESVQSLLAVPRDVDRAVNNAVEADVFEQFFNRLQAELASFEREAARLVSSAEPTRDEE